VSPSTATRPFPAEQRPWFRTVRLIHVVVVILAVAVIVTARPLLKEPDFVHRVTFENPTAYDLGIEVTDGGRDGWMPVWTVARSETTVAEEIYDIGDVWIFQFSAQGETTSELRVTRAELMQNNWHVAIPQAIGNELREKGASPPP
jgi:hypothetical protein